MTRKPRAFRLSEPETGKAPAKEKTPKAAPKPRKTARRPRKIDIAKVEMQPDAFDPNLAPVLTDNDTEKKLPRFIHWGSIAFSALISIIGLWVGLAFTRLVEDLFARSEIFGWLAIGLFSLLGIAAFAITIRELIGLLSLRKINRLREWAEKAQTTNDDKAATRLWHQLPVLYEDTDTLKWGRERLKEHDNDIIDAPGRVLLLERELLIPLDSEAGDLIANTARKVTLLTAVTPTAVLDIVFVAAMNLRLLRQLAHIYGGRPALTGTFRLARMVLSHLAIAGGLALTDNLVQQFIGKGLFGRLSARFGEGAVNGILTARIGLAALDVTRPIPFSKDTRPDLATFLKRVISLPVTNDDDKKK